MKNPDLNWAKRVSKRKIERLYESDAKGMLDSELLDDVGYSLYARLSDMFEIDEASKGKVKCRKCEAIITRKKGGLSSTGRIFGGKTELLICHQCDWQVTWGEYFESYSGKSLQPNSAKTVFADFLHRWPKQKTDKAKLLLIDWLIHQFHLQYKDKIPVKPAAINLIEGSSKQIAELLDKLAYGPESVASVQTRDEWHTQFNDKYRAKLTTVGANRIRNIGKNLNIQDYKKIPMKDLIDQIVEMDPMLLQPVRTTQK